MTMYSHSKLSSFEQCKQKYKFRYIDKIEPDFKQSIESHLGSAVHDTFEWLYNEVLRDKLPALDEVLEFYINRWQQNLNDQIKIVKEDCTQEDYFEKGIKFIADYYLKHQPFKDGTLELEKRIYITLDPNSPHKLVGYIDRVVYNKEKAQYEVHDYKTANSLPDRKIRTRQTIGIICYRNKATSRKPSPCPTNLALFELQYENRFKQNK